MSEERDARTAPGPSPPRRGEAGSGVALEPRDVALASAPGGAPGDIDTAEFRRVGHELIEWVARYLEGAERYPVRSVARPGAVRHALPAAPPASGESLDAMMADVERVLVPGITHWNHPGFLAYFATSASAPGILAELLTAAINVNGMLWITSPAATELEQHTLDWLRQMLGLEPGWFGMIVDTASISSLLALAAAREAHAELAIRERGLAGRAELPPLRIYASEEAHSSIDKAAITLGLGRENVVRVGVDTEFRMRPELLAAAIAADRSRGMLPIAAVATVGTTGTTSVDPVREIAAICRREAMWLHVDGAYGGMAAIASELRHALDGVELAHSLVVNPHKWLFTPMDCSVLLTRRPELLHRAFSLVPSYLATSNEGDVVNYMDYGVQLGRRFRALKLWMVIRAFGVSGLAERIRHHCALAREFAEWVSAEPEWEVLAPVPFSVVCFRYSPAPASEVERNALNARILQAVNASGQVFLSHTLLGERYTLRLAVGNIRTERRHIEQAWRLLREAARELAETGTTMPL